jgi:hypothetical protein
MNKHIQNLQRLCEKMEARYGKDDDFVMELRQELAKYEAKKARDAAAANLRRRKGDGGLTARPVH